MPSKTKTKQTAPAEDKVVSLSALSNAEIDAELALDEDIVSVRTWVSKGDLAAVPIANHDVCGISFVSEFEAFDPRTQRKEKRYVNTLRTQKRRVEEVERRLKNSFVALRYRFNPNSGKVFKDEWQAGETIQCYTDDKRAEYYRRNKDIVSDTIGKIGEYRCLADFFRIEITEDDDSLGTRMVERMENEKLRAEIMKLRAELNQKTES